MKTTFTPLKQPTVRPAGMPEGVAYEYLFDGRKLIAINRGNTMHGVDRHDGVLEDISPLDLDDNFNDRCEVLRRRDGKPLPYQEPVPLDTLQPWPVWYRGGIGHTWYQHDGMGGFTVYNAHTGEIEMHGRGAGGITVAPTPHKAEVQDESE